MNSTNTPMSTNPTPPSNAPEKPGSPNPESEKKERGLSWTQAFGIAIVSALLTSILPLALGPCVAAKTQAWTENST